MKVADAIKQMSKLPLQRIVDSFTKDFPKPDEDQARDIILRNVEELTDGKQITTVLQFDGPFKDQIRQILMLEAFVNRPDWSASEQEIVESLTGLEQDVLDAAASEDSLRYEDPDRIEILRDVLRAALADKLITFRELKQTLIKKKLPSSGTKSELKGRVISSGLSPSRVLGILSTEELRKLCSSLPGVPVSGSKAVRIQRIIGYFANLITKEVSDEASPGERFYQYLPELARRDRENLLANQIIGKDIDIERGFEAATRFLFESRLGLKLMEMAGSEHPDGCIRFGGRRKAAGDVLMWDNKSTETAYTFPPSHLRQFKRYIRDSSDPVACFLVVVADADDSAMDRVWQLAADCAGTNVAVIAAENLGWVAEEWWGRGVDGGFNLEVLNMTGILSRPLLEQRMRLFL